VSPALTASSGAGPENDLRRGASCDKRRRRPDVRAEARLQAVGKDVPFLIEHRHENAVAFLFFTLFRERRLLSLRRENRTGTNLVQNRSAATAHLVGPDLSANIAGSIPQGLKRQG